MTVAQRRESVAVKVGQVQVGGGAMVVVQSMTSTDTADVAATVAQVRELAEAGAEIVRVTREETPDDTSTHWSTRTLAERFGIGKDTVARVWRDHNIKPWRVDTFKISNDRRFEEKVEERLANPGDPEIDLLTRWIDAGAFDPRDAETVASDPARKKDELWSLQPVRRPDVPSVSDARWPRNDIDRFVLAKLEERGLPPSTAADRRTLIRRMTFDLTGLPPTV